jgi:hypothetical protein
MKPSEVILAARKLLTRKTWCKFERDNGRGAYCALGALSKVKYGVAEQWGPGQSIDNDIEVKILADLVPPEHKQTTYHYHDANGKVADYNNAKSTTLEDMKDWFCKAAQAAKAQE